MPLGERVGSGSSSLTNSSSLKPSGCAAPVGPRREREGVRAQRLIHLFSTCYCASGPARHVINYKQTCGLFSELPKNGDEPKSPLPQLAGSMMPSAGTVTFQGRDVRGSVAQRASKS